MLTATGSAAAMAKIRAAIKNCLLIYRKPRQADRSPSCGVLSFSNFKNPVFTVSPVLCPYLLGFLVSCSLSCYYLPLSCEWNYKTVRQWETARQRLLNLPKFLPYPFWSTIGRVTDLLTMRRTQNWRLSLSSCRLSRVVFAMSIDLKTEAAD